MFKVCGFWTFDLGALEKAKSESEQGENSAPLEAIANHVAADEENDCRFVVDLGVFSTIGPDDVFVCGNLNGLICIIQVPSSKLPVCNHPAGSNHDDIKSEAASAQSTCDRQLLLIKRLDSPVIDLKCGFFASTLKQSIAILTLEELVIYQVTHNTVDLLSGGNDGVESEYLDESLFSHRLQEHYRIKLAANEIPVQLIVLDSRVDGGVKDSTSRTSQSDINAQKRHESRTHHLQLPQRDMIVVQYANQFLYSIIDHRKVIGHFCFVPQAFNYNGVEPTEPKVDRATDQNDAMRNSKPLDELCKFTGPTAATCLRTEPNTSSLVIALSDGQIYCLPLAHLISLAKQTLMTRVAKNLIGGQESAVIKERASSLLYQNQTKTNGLDEQYIIPIQLDSAQAWDVELPCLPIHMLNLSSQSNSSIYGKNEHLLVMSRYYLDLFNGTGQHLWSHRSEAPIRCINRYPIHQQNQTSKLASHQADLNFLVCKDSYGEDRSDIIVMNQDTPIWSALLASRPIMIWRTRLNKISGYIAILECGTGTSLKVGYLGTHLENNFDDDLNEVEKFPLSQLASLDEPLFSSEAEITPTKQYRATFKFDIRLDAFDVPPKVRVKFKIRIIPQPHVTNALQDITAVLSYDNLLNCDIDDSNVDHFCPGSTQVRLGSCWPDRRDPLLLSGSFMLRNFLQPDQHIDLTEDDLLPKSLQVQLLLKFSNSPSGESIQEESFLLPLSIIAILEHVDYSSGTNQSLDDIFLNLPGYNRQLVQRFDDGEVVSVSYRAVDIIIQGLGDAIDILDEIIESDLVCRGSNSESSSYTKSLLTREQKLATMENLNLLAQSLDCRLKFKTFSRPKTIIRQQSSTDELLQVALISIALRVPSGSKLLFEDEKSLNDDTSSVWLHLCELSTHDIKMTSDFVRVHLSDWKHVECTEEHTSETRKADTTVLLSIECQQTLPSLYLLSHMIDRLKSRSKRLGGAKLQFSSINERHIDLIEIDSSNISKLGNLVALNRSLHDSLGNLKNRYRDGLVVKFKNLKKELQDGYNKLYVSSMASLSTARRLHDLPVDRHNQYNYLVLLTKKYYLNQVRLVSELEKLKRLDYHYSKFPNIEEILEAGTRNESQLDLGFPQIVD